MRKLVQSTVESQEKYTKKECDSLRNGKKEEQ
jgi:hypothetical protein